MDELHGEGTQPQLLPGREVVELDLPQPMLVELGAGHGDGQPAAVDGNVLPQFAEHPRQGPQVILVPVRDHERLDVLRPITQVTEIRKHEIDPQHVGGGKPEPGVDDEDAALVLDHGHVLADLAQAAERQDPEPPVIHA
jgi:hypothetical protein